VLVAAAAATAARVAAPAPERHAGFSAALACGVERWSIKTLKDRPRLVPARATTVGDPVSLPRPGAPVGDTPSVRAPHLHGDHRVAITPDSSTRLHVDRYASIYA
jgi:hypothetical protein